MNVADDFLTPEIQTHAVDHQLRIVEMIDIRVKGTRSPVHVPCGEYHPFQLGFPGCNSMYPDTPERFVMIMHGNEMNVITGLSQPHTLLVQDSRIERDMNRREMTDFHVPAAPRYLTARVFSCTGIT